MIYSMLTDDRCFTTRPSFHMQPESGLQMGEKKHRWICSAHRHGQGYGLSGYEYKILQRTHKYPPHPLGQPGPV